MALNSDHYAGFDRISNLPDELIDHILSFVLTIDAVRTSALSKRWRYFWYRSPTIHFSDADFRGRMDVFKRAVKECCTHRKRAMRCRDDATVTGFKLTSYFHFQSPGGVKEWLSSPLIKNYVKELDFCAPGQSLLSPPRPLAPVRGSSLVDVKLEGVVWDGSCSMDLPSLKALRLIRVSITGEALKNVANSCSVLESCLLKDISSDDVWVSSSSLRVFEISGEFRSVKVDGAKCVRSLEVSDLMGDRVVDFSSCGIIRDLSLHFFPNYEGAKNVYAQISRLAHIENLTLGNPSKNFKICTPTLKTFSVSNHGGQKLKITTETPNLVSFRYDGSTKFNMLMETPNHGLDGSFSIWKCYDSCDTKWYKELKKFLTSIDFSWSSVSVHIRDDEDLIIPKGMRTRLSPWPDLKHLKIVIHGELTRESELTESLKWIAPSLETISIEIERLC